MARKRRRKKKAGTGSPRVTFTTSQRIVDCLDELLGTGFYGRSRGQVAEDLVKQALKELYVPKIIRPRALRRPRDE